MRWFVTVKLFLTLPPAATLPYPRLVVDVVRAAVPVPVRATVFVPPATFAAMVKVDVRVPRAAGVKRNVILHLAAGATPPAGWQVVGPTANSGFEELMLETKSAALPEFLTGRFFVTVCESGALPTLNGLVTVIFVVAVAVGVAVRVGVEVAVVVAVAVAVEVAVSVAVAVGVLVAVAVAV